MAVCPARRSTSRWRRTALRWTVSRMMIDDDTDEDDVEVDDEEYFQSLPDNTRLMLLHHQDLWSPVGPPYM